MSEREDREKIDDLGDDFIERLFQEPCGRCDGTGKAIGSDRPFEWSGPGTYPGACPVCNGSKRSPHAGA